MDSPVLNMKLRNNISRSACPKTNKCSGVSEIWSAATCRRFFRSDDLSSEQHRVQRCVVFFGTFARLVVGCVLFFRRAAARGSDRATSRSVGESGDKSPHSKARPLLSQWVFFKQALGCAAIYFALVALMSPANAASDRTLSLGDRPLSFESNVGQYEGAARFVSRGPAYYLSLTPSEVNVMLRKVEKTAPVDNNLPRTINTVATRVDYRSLRIELIGANSVATMSGVGEVSGRASYFIGNDASKWRTGVPAFDRVRVMDVYPGINLIHYGNQNHLEYDFEIAPGASADVIAMKFTGADRIVVDTDGELVLSLGGEEIRQPKPVIYQTVRGARKEIAGGYVMTDASTVKFTLGDYDRTLPLVIDPVVSYSVFQGREGEDVFWATATDASGNLYLAGETTSASLASPGAFQTNLAGVMGLHGDVLVQKLPNFPQEYKVTYSTYLGGVANEAAFGLAVDADGNAYVAGYTGSTNFPTLNPVQTNIAGTVVSGVGRPPVDCFVAKIGPHGTNLIFSTFFGGSKDDAAGGIALDAATNIYVVGYTLSTNFPVVNFTAVTNLVGTNVVVTTNSLSGGEDAFVIKLAASGTSVIYSRYIGGAGRDYATDVITDSAGEPVLVGYTTSSLFPTTTNAVQPLFNGTTNFSSAYDAFVTIVGATNSVINYSSYLGGTNDDFAFRTATDAAGAIYVAGSTRSANFPRTSTNLYSSVMTNTLSPDAFVSKLNPSLTNWDYSVTFGGSASDEAWDVAVDSAGSAHIVGVTASINFPTNSAIGFLRRTNSGASDAFIAELNSTGSVLNYSAYIGGTADDAAYGVTVDAGNNVYVVGVAGNSTFPTSPSSTAGIFSDKDGFVLKILADPTLAISRSGTNVQLSWNGFATEFTLESRTNLVSTNTWTVLTNFPASLTNNRTVVTIPATNAARFFRLKK